MAPATFLASPNPVRFSFSFLLIYNQLPLTMGTHTAFFNEALSHISSPPPPVSDLYFVDDSALNVRGANALGWGHCVLFDESGSEETRLAHETPNTIGNGHGGAGDGVMCEEEENAEVAVKAAEDKQVNAPRISVVHRLQGASRIRLFSVLSDALSEGVLVLMDAFLARRTELRRVWPEVFKPDSDAASSTARSNGSAAT